MATPYSNEISLEELNKRKKKKRPGQPIADIISSQQMTAGYPGRAGSTATSSKFGEQVKGGPAPIVKPKVKPKPIPKIKKKKKPFQMLSAREAAELKQSGVKYKGIPEGSVPATVLSGSGDAGLSARDKAEMGMKKGRSVKKKKKGFAKGGMAKKGYAMGGKMKKGYAKGGKVRGVGIARKGVRPAKMR